MTLDRISTSFGARKTSPAFDEILRFAERARYIEPRDAKNGLGGQRMLEQLGIGNLDLASVIGLIAATITIVGFVSGGLWRARHPIRGWIIFWYDACRTLIISLASFRPVSAKTVAELENRIVELEMREVPTAHEVTEHHTESKATPGCDHEWHTSDGIRSFENADCGGLDYAEVPFICVLCKETKTEMYVLRGIEWKHAREE